MTRRPANQIVLFAYYTAVSVGILALTLARPYNNWDMVAYAASALSLQTDDVHVVHRTVYRQLHESVPQSTYQTLTSGGHRAALSRDPEAFAQQLPFYQIRMLYVVLVSIMARVGINLFVATHLISALAVIAGLWLLLIAFRPLVGSVFLYATPIAGVLLGLVDLAKYSTPDGLAFLMVVWIVFFIVRGSWRALLVIPLSVLVRTDLILFAVITVLFVIVESRRRRLAAVLSLASAVVACLLVNNHFGYYGFETVYYNTFVEPLTRPADTSIVFGWPQYAAAMRSGITDALTNRAFLLFSLIVVLMGGIAWRRRTGASQRPAASTMRFVVLSSLIYVAVHFAAFPEIEARFFVAQYLLSFVGLAWLLGHEVGGEVAGRH